MRTTISIDDHLLDQAKKLAMDSNMSLSALLEHALKEMIYRRQSPTKRKDVKLVTYKGKGLQKGVDLDNSAATLDLMEGN